MLPGGGTDCLFVVFEPFHLGGGSYTSDERIGPGVPVGRVGTHPQLWVVYPLRKITPASSKEVFPASSLLYKPMTHKMIIPSKSSPYSYLSLQDI